MSVLIIAICLNVKFTVSCTNSPAAKPSTKIQNLFQ